MTNFQIKEFDNSIAEEFFLFCKEASSENTQPASVNMWSEQWHTQPNTLPYILTHTDRFAEPNGKFFILYKDNTIVGCSGVYISQFSNEVALAGVRTWISTQVRHLLLPREFLLPAQKEWSMRKKLKIIALTFNDYNKNMIVLWKRMRLGETRSAREPKHIFYNGLMDVDFPVNIQYTKQWVAYEQLDPALVFDWTTIKWK